MFKKLSLLAVATLVAACSSPDMENGGSIKLDSLLPLISVKDVAFGEGSSAADTKSMVFELTLDKPSSEEVSVNWSITQGSATAGDDYSDAAGTAIFAAGETSLQIAISLVSECVIEPDETLRLHLSDANNAEISNFTAVGTIVNDDAEAALLPGTGGKLWAGAAEDRLRVPIGTPLGGYLRPPVGGDFFPAGEAFAEGDAGAFFDAIAERNPDGTDHNGVPITPVPPEASTASSPYATYSPPSRGYFDSLITKAVALDNGENTVVIVKTDLIGMNDELPLEVARRVLERTGVDLGDGIIMTATHTHDGPGALANNAIRYFWLAMDNYKPEIAELLTEEITRVVIQSLENMVPARFGYNSGQESRERSLNSYRRTRSIYTDERVAQQDLLRKRIGVLRVDEVDDNGDSVRPIAAILNYSAHGIAFSVENFLFSGDVLSSAEREFEAQFDEPMIAMFIQSAGGDVNPRADGGNALVRIERFGKFFAPQAKAIYDSVNNFDTRPAMEVKTQRLALNLENLGYDDTEYPYPYGATQCNNNGGEDCIASPAPDADDLADNNVGENAAFVPQDTRLAILRIGSALMLIQPGEPVAEYGLRIVEDSPYGMDNTFVFSLAQDHVGYILPNLKEDWLLGGTEGTTTFWGWKLGGRLRQATADLVASLACAPEPEDDFEAIYRVDEIVPAEPTASPLLGRLITQTTDIQRFETTKFGWEGGDPVVDLPVVTMQIMSDGGTWETARRKNGKPLNVFYEMHISYVLSSGSHLFEVEFEAPLDWPLGTYRFSVEGQAFTGTATEAYSIESEPFAVTPADNLALSAVTSDGDQHSVTFSYPALPDNYRVIDPEIHPDNPAPVRVGSVEFNFDSGSILVTNPSISEDGVATYSASSSSPPLSVTASDQFDNVAP